MFCPECGKTIEEGVVFCPDCGAKVGETLHAVPPVIQPIKKPMGVMFIVFFTIFMGLLTMLLGAILYIAGYVGLGIAGEIPFLGGPLGGALTEVTKSQWSLFFSALAGYFFLFFGIFYLTAAYGLGSLTEWGRKLAVVLYLMAVPLSLLSLIGLRLTFGLVILELVWIVVLVVIIFHLSKPDVKKLFQ
jgi:hypothetical protein